MKSQTNEKHDLQAVDAFRFKSAVIGLSFGPSDQTVLRVLRTLVQTIGLKVLHFVHVEPLYDVFNIFPGNSPSALPSGAPESQGDIRQRMQLLVDEQLGETDAEISFEVREGDPLESLICVRGDRPCDLLVIGQRTGPGHHGILAKNLVRKTEGPALIIPERAGADIRRLLVPVDFSESAARALRAAAALQQQIGEKADLTCVNVYDLPNFSAYRVQETREELRHMLEEDRRAAFQAFIETQVPGISRYHTELIERKGPGIAQYLLDFAESQGSGLIVMGARGHSRVELLLLGSVTEKLLSLDRDKPVLIIK